MRLKNFLVYASIMPILTCFISTQAYANPPEDKRNRSGIFMHTSEGLTHSEGCTLICEKNATSHVSSKKTDVGSCESSQITTETNNHYHFIHKCYKSLIQKILYYYHKIFLKKLT